MIRAGQITYHYGIRPVLVDCSFELQQGELGVFCGHMCVGRRFALRRWFIWEHDKLLIVPFALIMIGLGLPTVIRDFLHLSHWYSVTWTTFIVVWTACCVGPSSRILEFTGVHDLFPSTLQSQMSARQSLTGRVSETRVN